MKQTLLQRWDRFFYRTVPPHTFAILRIGFALFLMLYWGSEWRDAALFSREFGVFLPKISTDISILTFFLQPPLWFVHVFFVITFLLLTMFLVGYRTRTTALLLLILSIYFYFWNQWLFATSFYRLFQFSLAVFLFPGADKAFSMAMWRKHGSFWAWQPMSIFPLRLFALQLTATYLGVGWQKLILPGWDSGAVLFHSFTSRWGTSFGFYLARILPSEFLDWLVWLTLLLECTMPFGLWIRKVQWIYFLGGFVFHTLITLTLGIWWFQIMVPMYIVFLDPEAVFQWVRVRSKGKISPDSSAVL